MDRTENPLVWRPDEGFVDRAAFEAHQLRASGSDWFTATGTLGRDFTITEG